jgi:hypothetical protein
VQAGIAVMTLVVKVILLAIEVATSFGFFGLAVTTDGATTVPGILVLLFKQAELVANLVQILNIDKKTHRKGSILGAFIV